jgi:hypothetical protein
MRYAPSLSACCPQVAAATAAASDTAAEQLLTFDTFRYSCSEYCKDYQDPAVAATAAAAAAHHSACCQQYACQMLH